MKISPIVKRLRENVPLFLNRVDGIIEFSKILNVRNFDLPCAFVVPTGETASENGSFSSYEQDYTADISIYVYLSTKGVKSETEGHDIADTVKRELIRSLAGYQIDAKSKSQLLYEGFEVTEINPEFIAFKMDFSAIGHITQDETALNVEAVPLETIYLEYPDKAELGDYIPTSKITLHEV